MKKRLSVIMAAVMIMPLWCIMPKAAEKYAPPESAACEYNFNYDWLFSKPYSKTWPLSDAMSETVDKSGHKFYEPGFDDDAWEDVSLPHTFNDEDSFRNVSQDAGDGGIYRGIAFYRKHFSVPKEENGKKVIIEFEGARQGSYVWVNGEMAGYYEAGVSLFGMDLTKYINYGEENVIAVAPDNTSSRGMTGLIAETKPGSAPGSNDGSRSNGTQRTLTR